MKKSTFLILATMIFVFSIFETTLAQNNNKQPTRFSPKGLKAIFALGGSAIPAQKNLVEGNAVNLGLGYGFSNHSSLWLTIVGSTFKDQLAKDSVNAFTSLELAYEYKILPNSRFQPYGKIGLGPFSTKTEGSNIMLTGGGFIFAMGVDLFFARHFGVGLELSFKDVEYTQREVERADGKKTTDIKPHLNRDAVTLMLTLKIQ